MLCLVIQAQKRFTKNISAIFNSISAPANFDARNDFHLCVRYKKNWETLYERFKCMESTFLARFFSLSHPFIQFRFIICSCIVFCAYWFSAHRLTEKPKIVLKRTKKKEKRNETFSVLPIKFNDAEWFSSKCFVFHFFSAGLFFGSIIVCSCFVNWANRNEFWCAPYDSGVETRRPNKNY